jgi:hypothetical protein
LVVARTGLCLLGFRSVWLKVKLLGTASIVDRMPVAFDTCNATSGIKRVRPDPIGAFNPRETARYYHRPLAAA